MLQCSRVEYEEWDAMVIQRWWRSFGRSVRDVSDVSPAFKLRRCTFSSLRAVVRQWWSSGLFGFHMVNPVFPAGGERLLDFRAGSTRSVPQLYRCRYLRVRQTVKFRCLLVPLLVFVHRWWDYHLQPHPTDRPHLYAGKYTKDYLLSVGRYFDGPTSKMVIPSGWFCCFVGCKRLFPCKFMSEKGCFCFMCEDDCDY